MSANDGLEHRRIERVVKGAAYALPSGPGDGGCAWLKPGQSKPDRGATLKVKVRLDPKTVGRQVAHPHKNSLSAALAKACGQRSVNPLSLALIGGGTRNSKR